MFKNAIRIWLITLSLALASCQSVPREASQAILGGVGAALGHELSDGEALGTALGAVAGVASGGVMEEWREGQSTAAYQRGYQQAQGDQIKRHYWMQRNLHREETGDGLIRSYHEVPVPGHVAKDGTIIEGHTQVVEVVE